MQFVGSLGSSFSDFRCHGSRLENGVIVGVVLDPKLIGGVAKPLGTLGL